MKITELKSIYFEAKNGEAVQSCGYVVCKQSRSLGTDDRSDATGAHHLRV